MSRLILAVNYFRNRFRNNNKKRYIYSRNELRMHAITIRGGESLKDTINTHELIRSWGDKKKYNNYHVNSNDNEERFSKEERDANRCGRAAPSI
jgi:hypothetical protein